MGDDLANKLARKFDITLQQAKFFALLISYECVTCKRVYQEMGTVEGRQLAFRLRARLKEVMPDAVIHSRRMVGYWLDEATRAALLVQYNVVPAMPESMS